jgi:hypothetical protein
VSTAFYVVLPSKRPAGESSSYRLEPLIFASFPFVIKKYVTCVVAKGNMEVETF